MFWKRNTRCVWLDEYCFVVLVELLPMVSSWLSFLSPPPPFAVSFLTDDDGSKQRLDIGIECAPPLGIPPAQPLSIPRQHVGIDFFLVHVELMAPFMRRCHYAHSSAAALAAAAVAVVAAGG